MQFCSYSYGYYSQWFMICSSPPHNNKTCMATNYCSHSKCTVAAAYMNSYRYCNKMRISYWYSPQFPGTLLVEFNRRTLYGFILGLGCPFRTLKILKVNTLNHNHLNQYATFTPHVHDTAKPVSV